ncbi:MAG: hypothetical protein ACFE68_02550 [Candidatus Hodarchaeota archaeon]
MDAKMGPSEGVILPDWFLLKRVSGLDFDPEEWVDLADERIERFSRRERWLLRRSSTVFEEEWMGVVKKEFAGHVLLRLAVSEDERLASWLVENEGDLFEYRFRAALNKEKLQVMRFLFGKDKMLSIKELQKVLGEADILKRFGLHIPSRFRHFRSGIEESSGYVAIYFTDVPDVIGSKRALLYKGWAIAPLFVFFGSIKRKFETLLREKIKRLLDRVAGEPALQEKLKAIRDKLRKIAKKYSSDFGFEPGEIPSSTSLFNRVDLMPPCMQELIMILSKKGHLEHGERFQLGLFLKRLGMSLEDQLRFWYDQAVDNIGITYEEFTRKVGYIIRHLYGLEGSKTDYSPPKCKTIAESYFCTFAHKDPEEVEKTVLNTIRLHSGEEKILKNYESFIAKIKSDIVSGKPILACKIAFQLVFDKPLKHLSHPLQWFYQAAKKEGLLKVKNNKEK